MHTLYITCTAVISCVHVHTAMIEAVLASGKWVNFGSGECTESSLVWRRLTSCFKVCGVQRFHSQKVCACKWLNYVSCQEQRNLCHCFISEFSILLLKRKLQYGGHKWVIYMWVIYMWVTPRLLCARGSVCQQVWPTLNPDQNFLSGWGASDPCIWDLATTTGNPFSKFLNPSLP